MVWFQNGVLKTGQKMSIMVKMSGFWMVHLITWSDHLKTGQKSYLKSQMFGFLVRYSDGYWFFICLGIVSMWCYGQRDWLHRIVDSSRRRPLRKKMFEKTKLRQAQVRPQVLHRPQPYLHSRLREDPVMWSTQVLSPSTQVSHLTPRFFRGRGGAMVSLRVHATKNPLLTYILYSNIWIPEVHSGDQNSKLVSIKMVQKCLIVEWSKHVG